MKYVIIAYSQPHISSRGPLYWIGNEESGRKWTRKITEAMLYPEKPYHWVLDRYGISNQCQVIEVDENDIAVARMLEQL